MVTLTSPVDVGQDIYSIGHGNKKTPQRWTVSYLGWNGQFWTITITSYDSKDSFIESRSITDQDITERRYFTSYESCYTELYLRRLSH